MNLEVGSFRQSRFLSDGLDSRDALVADGVAPYECHRQYDTSGITPAGCLICSLPLLSSQIWNALCSPASLPCLCLRLAAHCMLIVTSTLTADVNALSLR